MQIIADGFGNPIANSLLAASDLPSTQIAQTTARQASTAAGSSDTEEDAPLTHNLDLTSTEPQLQDITFDANSLPPLPPITIQAQPGDTISGLLGTSDPIAIEAFMHANNMSGTSSTIYAGQPYTYPSADDYAAAAADNGAQGQATLNTDNANRALALSPLQQIGPLELPDISIGGTEASGAESNGETKGEGVEAVDSVSVGKALGNSGKYTFGSNVFGYDTTTGQSYRVFSDTSGNSFSNPLFSNAFGNTTPSYKGELGASFSLASWTGFGSDTTQINLLGDGDGLTLKSTYNLGGGSISLTQEGFSASENFSTSSELQYAAAKGTLDGIGTASGDIRSVVTVGASGTATLDKEDNGGLSAGFQAEAVALQVSGKLSSAPLSLLDGQVTASVQAEGAVNIGAIGGSANAFATYSDGNFSAGLGASADALLGPSPLR